MADSIHIDGKAYIPIQVAVEFSGLSEQAIRAAAQQGKVWLRAIGTKIYVERDGLDRLKGMQPLAGQTPPRMAPIQKVMVPTSVPAPITPLPQKNVATTAPVREIPKIIVPPAMQAPVATAVRPDITAPKAEPQAVVIPTPQPEASTVAAISQAQVPATPVARDLPKIVVPPIVQAPAVATIKTASKPETAPEVPKPVPAEALISKMPMNTASAPGTPIAEVKPPAATTPNSLEEAIKTTGVQPIAAVPVVPPQPVTPAAPSPIEVPVPSPIQPVVSPIRVAPQILTNTALQSPRPLMQQAQRPLLSSALALVFTLSTLGGGFYAFTHMAKVKGMVAAVGDAVSALSSSVAYDANAPKPTSANLTYGSTLGTDGGTQGGAAAGTATSSRTSAVLPVQNGKPATYIYNYPVIERIVPQSGFITEGELSDKLNELSNRLVSMMYANTSAPNSLPASGGVVNNIALTQRIDNLGRVDISNSTFVDGSITSTSIGATTLSVSGLASLATTTLGNTTINGTGGSDFFDVNDAGGNTVFAVRSDGTLISNTASTTQSVSQLLVTGSATATNMVILNTASTSNLLFTNATGTNATINGRFIAGSAYFGSTATSSFDSAGALTLSSALGIASGGTGLTTIGASSTVLISNGTSIAWQQLQFAPRTSGSSILLGDGAGGFNSYAGSSCTNQFVRSINGAGVATCAAVSLTADVTGTLPQGNGGTGISSYSAGDILFADGAGFLQKLPIGASGNVLTVQAGLPAWGTSGVSGGAGVVGAWATTTNDQVLYPATTAWIVNIGGNATSSLNSILEVHGQSYFSSNVGIGTTSPQATLSVGGNGYITGGLGVGVLNAAAGTIQSTGTATVGNLVNNGVTANTLIYVNGSKQESSATISSATGLSFSGGTLSLSAIPNSSLANSTISGIALGNNLASLTATNSTLTFSGAYNGGSAQTVGLNLANANTWTGLQTFANASSSIFSAYNAYFGSTATSSFSASGALSLVTNGLTVGTDQLVASGGNVGIGTTTPFRKLSVTDTVSAAQVAIAYDASRYTQLQVDSAGDFHVNPSGGDTQQDDSNLWICSGGSCPTGTPSGTGNLVVETSLGVGTTTPWGKFALDTGTGSVASNGLNINSSPAAGYADLYIRSNWGDGNAAGNLVDIANAQTSKLVFTNAGNLGIGTSTPSAQLAAAGLLFIGANGATGMGTATSTFYGDIKINGKLDVSTIDPVYTIDGIKYATYGASTVGIHEETVFKVMSSTYDAKRKLFDHAIDFSNLEKGSDLWLFYQITDFGSNWDNLVVTLTPGFDGHAFYEQDVAHNTLHILSDKEGPVSVRLIANRYDFSKWPNLRTDQDGDTAGTHVISSKPSTGDVSAPTQ